MLQGSRVAASVSVIQRSALGLPSSEGGWNTAGGLSWGGVLVVGVNEANPATSFLCRDEEVMVKKWSTCHHQCPDELESPPVPPFRLQLLSATPASSTEFAIYSRSVTQSAQ